MGACVFPSFFLPSPLFLNECINTGKPLFLIFLNEKIMSIYEQKGNMGGREGIV